MFTSCKNSVKTDSTSEKEKTNTIISQNESTEVINEATTNEEAAEKIMLFLKEKNKDVLNDLTDQDRKFSFYEIDLNDNNQNEYLIYMMGRYFCGTGGCSFYLLNHDFSINTYFTVTNPPIYRSAQKTNGWHDLILWGDQDENGGVKNYIHLKFNKSQNKYPENPSLINKTELAPSGSDFIMWSDDFSKAKTFTF